MTRIQAWGAGGNRVGILVAVTVFVALVAVALVFSRSVGARQVADDAEALHVSNTAAGHAAVTRAAVSQAVLFAVDRELGVADQRAVEIAVGEAHHNIELLIGSRDDLRGRGTSERGGEVDDSLDAFIEAASAVVSEIEAGRPAAADDLRSGVAETAYADLEVGLSATQAAILAEIRATEQLAGTIETITRIVVTLAIPMGAIVAHRMSARLKMQAAQAGMQARLDAERAINRAKDEFIAGVSHELRTPLTGIYGFSEHLVERGLIDPSEAMELISLINHDAAELSRMVEDLLTAARLEAGSLSIDVGEVDLIDETEKVLVTFRRQGADVSITGSTDGEFIALADADRTRRILRNLISNAYKHGGPSIRVQVSKGDGLVRWVVADDGAGISPELEDRLFERFLHDGKGSLLAGSVGLGLAIARSLARAMDGDLVHRRHDGWTEFTLALPDPKSAAMCEPLPLAAAG